MSTFDKCNVCNEDYCIKKDLMIKILTRTTVKASEDCSQYITFPENHILLKPNDELDNIYILNNGKARIYRVDHTGEKQILRLLNVGDLLGDAHIFDSEVYEYYVETTTECEFFLINKNEFKSIVKNNNNLSIDLIRYLSNKIEDLELLVNTLTFHTAGQRLAAYLVSNAKKVVPKDDGTIQFKISLNRDEIADLLGLTRETVSRRLNYFKKLSFIDIKGKNVTIHNINKLEELMYNECCH
ncbi:Crp/Fnr family transcriptional regulator [Haloplasma contractile]|uniref:Fumarate protein n=1 Tax=Haloplasma contractile SSD-17B TaxID=1033810 RepID=F7PWP6_9MOLU|nr:Crp/Fnr family transcriptional regulator [Haloplasma contractile]ERJ12579.1 Fumarate protein [Haloplasma contractile SSD-17B]